MSTLFIFGLKHTVSKRLPQRLWQRFKFARMTRLNIRASAAVLLMSLTAFARAELEVGLGMSVTQVPHYIGAEQSSQYYLPFPYLRYRSKTLQIDRNFVQATLWEQGRWLAVMSFAGEVPVKSSSNNARKGMADLDLILEAGPALQYFVQGDRMKDNVFLFELPLRGAASTDFTQIAYRGLTFNPRAVWRRGYYMDEYFVRPQLSFGLRFATEHLHDYVYGVEEDDRTDARPVYTAEAGYGGWQVNYSTVVRWNNKLLAGFMRYVHIEGAAFEDSPLVKRDNSLILGLAFAHIF